MYVAFIRTAAPTAPLVPPPTAVISFPRMGNDFGENFHVRTPWPKGLPVSGDLIPSIYRIFSFGVGHIISVHPSFIILTRAYRSTVPEMTTECSLVFVVVRLAKKKASTSHLAYPAKNIIGQIRKKDCPCPFLNVRGQTGGAWGELRGSSGRA